MSTTEPNPSEILNHPVVPAVTTHLCYINFEVELLVGCRFLCVNSNQNGLVYTSPDGEKMKVTIRFKADMRYYPSCDCEILFGNPLQIRYRAAKLDNV